MGCGRETYDADARIGGGGALQDGEKLGDEDEGGEMAFGS